MNKKEKILNNFKNYKAKSGLEQEVYEIIAEKIESYDSDMVALFQDLEHGCSLGMVMELMYHADCIEFTKKHLEDILDLVVDWGAEVEIKDRSTLAWFAFEVTAHDIGREIGIEF